MTKPAQPLGAVRVASNYDFTCYVVVNLILEIVRSSVVAAPS